MMDGPHSRACGIGRHVHGADCHVSCPTCHGEAVSAAPEKVDRGFRLQLTITDADESGLSGLRVVLGLMKDVETDKTPIVVVQAGGLPATAEGAAELAEFLVDTATAIRDHLDEGVVAEAAQVSVEQMRTTPVQRPRFNPRPMGGERRG